jgi:hypothetical protein
MSDLIQEAVLVVEEDDTKCKKERQTTSTFGK